MNSNPNAVVDAANRKLETVARLIAGENLSIRHDRSASTAYIDLQSRTMTLPVWKEMSGPLYDLMVTHECSHAKHTPLLGQHTAGSPKGAKFKMFLNIVEDARIERLIKEEYPGLKRIHAQGYQELSKRDFFKLKGKDVSKMLFIDRLNLRCKLGSLISLHFSPVEKYLMKKVDEAKTFNDVLYVTKLIWGYSKEEMQRRKEEEKQKREEAKNKPEPKKKESKPQPEVGEDGESDQDDSQADQKSQSGEQADPDENGEEARPTRSDSKDAQPDFGGDDEDEEAEDSEEGNAGENPQSGGNEAENTGESDDSDEEGEEQEGEEQESGSEAGGSSLEKRLNNAADAPESEDDPTSETEEAFRQNESSLLDNSSCARGVSICPIPNVDLKNFTVPAEKLLPIIKNYYQTNYREQFNAAAAAVKQFLRDESKTISQLVMEFELRQNASQMARARESKCGRVDIKKLAKYRFTDNIFASMMKVEEGKNHAMVLVFDQSASIEFEYANMLEQLIVLAEFCRRLNIPFEMYGFCDQSTSRGTYLPGELVTNEVLGTSGALSTGYVHMKQYLRSDMAPALYQQALQTLWALRDSTYRPHFESFSGTPLNSAIVLSGQIAMNLKSRTNVDVMNVVVLTDGEATDNVFSARDWNTKTEYSWRGMLSDAKQYNLSSKFADLVKRGADCNIVLLYITSRSDSARSAVGRFVPTKLDGTKDTRGAMEELNKNGFYVTKTQGWSGYFILRPRNDGSYSVMNGKDKTKKLAAAFADSVVAKRGNRRFLSVFAEMISSKI